MQKDGQIFGIISPLTATLWVFIGIYLACNCSERLSDKFLTIGDSVYDCEWYSFPTNVQKMLTFMMAATQKPIILKGYGNLSYRREAFKIVFNQFALIFKINLNRFFSISDSQSQFFIFHFFTSIQ